MNGYKRIIEILRRYEIKSKLKILLPYFVAVISGVTTYFLYAFFNREIVNIQSVSVRPKEITLTIDRQLANKLSRLMNESSTDFNQNGNVDLTTINKDYIFESIKLLSSRSGMFSDKISEQTKIKNHINEIRSDSLSRDEISHIGNIDYPIYPDIDDYSYYGAYNHRKRKFGKQQLLDQTNELIEEYTKTKNEIDEVIKSLAQKSKKALVDNKDKFQIEIIAFNDGNRQTVIRQKGSLLIGQTTINLKKASTQRIEDYYSKLSRAISGKYHQDRSSSNYLIIEPKSFIVMSLEIDVFNNKNRDIEVIKREYLSGQSKVELTLFDIKNTPIKPFHFLLQNDIEFDPNEELSKYLSPLIEE